MLKAVSYLILLVFAASAARADLGDTLDQSRLKYGEPSATKHPQILAYTHGQYQIWQTYNDKNICITAEFSPLDPGSLTRAELKELDRNNLPGLVPGIGPGWTVLTWSNALSFQYTSPDCHTRYQVVTGKDHGHYTRMYLSDEGIAFLKSLQ